MRAVGLTDDLLVACNSPLKAKELTVIVGQKGSLLVSGGRMVLGGLGDGPLCFGIKFRG